MPVSVPAVRAGPPLSWLRRRRQQEPVRLAPPEASADALVQASPGHGPEDDHPSEAFPQLYLEGSQVALQQRRVRPQFQRREHPCFPAKLSRRGANYVRHGDSGGPGIRR
jgi:hypothetical protein